MSVLTTKRHPNVPFRALPLTEAKAEDQIRKGLRVVERGEPFALPVDRIGEPTVFQSRKLWVKSRAGVHRPGARMTAPELSWVPKAWAVADRFTGGRATYARNMVAFGHDVHVTTWGNLYGKHWHNGWADPFTGEVVPALDATFATLRDTHFVPHDCDLDACPATIWASWSDALTALQGRGGFVETLGWLSGAKVTTAFVSEEIDELVSATASEYADFDFHEVGTSAVAESNAHTALQTTSGIARATGTPTDSDPIYQNVGTITADATETWQEHGLFNNVTSVAMMDRSLTGGQSVNASDQVQYTYQLTKNAEA